MSGEMVDATGYLVVEGARTRWSPYRVSVAKIGRVTQKKPTTLHADEIAVKVTIRLPAKAFDALQPEAVILVPEELIQHPVQVEAVDPDD
jgi:hypothetical protein